MRFNEFIEQCKDDDVCSHGNHLFKIGKLKEVVTEAFQNRLFFQFFGYLKETHSVDMMPTGYINGKYAERPNLLFGDGVDFSILRANSQGWEKGKLKINITLEFIPDEVENIESPLDEIRQEINQG